VQPLGEGGLGRDRRWCEHDPYSAFAKLSDNLRPSTGAATFGDGCVQVACSTALGSGRCWGTIFFRSRLWSCRRSADRVRVSLTRKRFWLARHVAPLPECGLFGRLDDANVRRGERRSHSGCFARLCTPPFALTRLLRAVGVRASSGIP
jgi:hypothetical protein